MKPIKLIEKYKMWIVLAILVLAIISIIKQPVFFDNFGIGVFIFLFFSSMYMLTAKKYPEWLLWIIAIIGISGIIVDGIQILK